MTEAPECPYCGEEMELHNIPTGLWWYQCGCCGAIAPSDETPEKVLAAALSRVGACATCRQLSKVLCGKEHTTFIELLNAVEQLKRRAEPENRVLTLGEAQQISAEDGGVWLEEETAWGLVHITPIDDETGACTIYSFFARFYLMAEKYGKTWRCWLRKPTAEEREKEKWND